MKRMIRATDELHTYTISAYEIGGGRQLWTQIDARNTQEMFAKFNDKYPECDIADYEIEPDFDEE